MAVAMRSSHANNVFASSAATVMTSSSSSTSSSSGGRACSRTKGPLHRAAAPTLTNAKLCVGQRGTAARRRNASSGSAQHSLLSFLMRRPLGPAAVRASPDDETPAGGIGMDEAEERWQEMFRELKEYKASFGHTNVVLGNPLGRWVYKQRDLSKAGKVPEHRRELLDAEGFEWEHPFETQGSDWELMYSQLLEFRDAQGNCAVKKKYNENPALGYWVNDQRIAQREGRLTSEQEERLSSIGFEWEARKQCGSKFMIGFRELLEYRDAHGTIEVPEDNPEFAPLRTWITAQRGAHRKGILSEKRVDYLEGIGFRWEE